jgi:hypothetical protein
LEVISACLQDALVPVRDLAFVADERAFLLVANRFRWESGVPSDGAGKPPADRAGAGFERILCGVAFAEVTAVSYRGFRRSEDQRILSLLAIRPETGAGGSAVQLEFAGDAAIRLEIARIAVRLKDLGEPWPTAWRPGHALDAFE